MAEQLIVDVLGDNPERQLDSLLLKMDVVEKRILSINDLVKSLGGGGGSGVTLQSAVNAQEQAVKIAKQATDALEIQRRAAEKLRLEEIQRQQRLEKAFDDYERKLQKQQEAEQRAYAARQKAAEKADRDAERAMERNQKASELRQKQLEKESQAELKAAEAARQRAAAQASATVDPTSLKAMSDRLEGLRTGYQRLTLAERENANIGGVVLARIKELDTQLKASDATQGKYQRNVGNYASAYNGLGFAIRNIAGELPNLGISIRTFTQSISNNIGPLSDAIRQAREQNAALRAEGNPTISIGKQIASSIFNWQTAILAAVAAITFLVTAVTKAKGATADSQKAIDKYNKSLENIAENSRSSAQEEIAHANVLVAVAANTNETMKNRRRAMKELQETYPDRFGSLEKEAILEGKVAEALRLTTQELLNKAAAQAAEKRFAAASEQVYDLQLALKAANAEVDKYQKAVDRNKNNPIGFTKTEYSLRLSSAKGKVDEITKSLNEARAAQQGFLNDAKNFAQKAGDTIFNDTKDKKTKVKRTPDFTNEDLKAEVDLTAALYDQWKLRSQNASEQQKEIADDETNNLQKRADAYADYTANRLNEAGFEAAKERSIIQLKLDKIAEIEEKSADKRTNEEKRLLLSKKALEVQLVTVTDKYEHERTKIIEDNVRWQNQLIKSYGKDAEDAIKRSADNLKGLGDFYAGTGLKQSRGQYEQAYENKIRLQDVYINGAMSTEQQLAELRSELNQRRINEIDKEIEKIRERASAEEDAVKYSAAYATLTEQQRNDKILEIRAAANEQEKSLEREKIQRQRRNAIFQKALTVTEIIAETSLAVVRALNDKAVPTYYLRLANAISAGVFGAAKAAVAAAAPIPQFKRGGRHKGGLAEVGDGGQHEVFVSDAGEKMLTPNKSTILPLPPGRIYPSVEDYIARSHDYVFKGMGVMKRVDERRELSTKEMEHLLRRVANATEVLTNKEAVVIKRDWSQSYYLKVKQ